MLDESYLIPFCNDELTRLCYDKKWQLYYVYAPSAGRKFPTARTPEGAWKKWYIALADMTPDKNLRSIFLSASLCIKGPIPMNMVEKIQNEKRQKEAV